VVAIKRLLTDDPATIERFVSEVRLLARLRHPNLILFMGYCTTPQLVIVNEYMAKGSLYSVLHNAEARKQRAAAAAKADTAAGGGGGAAGSGGGGAAAAAPLALPAPPSNGGSQAAPLQPQRSSLAPQPSLVEGQLPLHEEIK
jgi:hypothetical protein